jgi:MATE family multidrug resistance protein
MVAKVIPFLSLFFFPDSAQGYLSGPIRALGLQEEASKMVLIAYYIIGVPSAIFFAFKLHLGIIGFWFG